MRNNSRFLLIRSLFAILISISLLFASCEWYGSDEDASKKDSHVTKTDDDADHQQDSRDETSDIKTLESKTGKIEAEEQVYTIPDQKPEFPGGEEALLQYLKDNIEYPARAKEENIEGTVYVGFIVQSTGNVGNVKVMRGMGVAVMRKQFVWLAKCQIGALLTKRACR